MVKLLHLVLYIQLISLSIKNWLILFLIADHLAYLSFPSNLLVKYIFFDYSSFTKFQNKWFTSEIKRHVLPLRTFLQKLNVGFYSGKPVTAKTIHRFRFLTWRN